MCFYMKKEYDPGYNLYELSDRLRTRGWQVPAFSLPADVSDVVVMRVMVRRGVTMDMADLLLHDMERSMEFLSKHQPSTHTNEAEAGMFKHT